MKKEIADLEERLRLAMLHSDIAELDRLISPDLLFTNHLGVLISKSADLDAHVNKVFEFESIALSESKILLLDHAAVVSVKADIKGTYHGQQANGLFRFTRFWSNLTGTWQLVAGHASLIA